MEQEFINTASLPGGTPERRDTRAENGESDALQADEQAAPQDRDRAAAERGGHGRRRLFSLTSQLRRPPQSRQQIEARHEAEARQRAELGETPEPRSRNEQEQARRAAEEGAGRNGSGAAAAPAAAAIGNGNGAAAAAVVHSEEAGVPSAEAAPREAGTASTGTAPTGTAPVAPAPRRPSRPIYTLQQVHEMTAIPYPTLAFYAASEASRIPSLGERHAPAYPFESLQAFCRLHAERTPGWEIPDLTPPDDEISLRLEALERGQQQLEAVLQAVLAELAEPLSGTSH